MTCSLLGILCANFPLLAHDTVVNAGPAGHTKWFLNSGASFHMTPHLHLFSLFKEASSIKVVVRNELEADVRGCGAIFISLIVNIVIKKCLLSTVLLVPKLQYF